MNDKKSKQETPKVTIDTLIDQACIQIEDQADYQNSDTTVMIDNLSKLSDIKDKIKPKKSVSPDAILAVGANLAGIVLILNFEKFGIVTSKALGFVQKLRL